jgi:hypothetical protein
MAKVIINIILVMDIMEVKRAEMVAQSLARIVKLLFFNNHRHLHQLQKNTGQL